MKQIQEAGERLIALTYALQGILGEVQRQGSIGTQYPEEAHPQLGGTIGFTQLERGERSRGERHRRLLPEPNRLVFGAQRLAETRLTRVQRFQPAQRLQEVERPRLAAKRFEEGYRIGRSPHRGTQRMTSPRVTDRSEVSVKALIDT